MKISKKERAALQNHYGHRKYKINADGELFYRKYSCEEGGYWYWAFGGYIGEILIPAEKSQYGIL